MQDAVEVFETELTDVGRYSLQELRELTDDQFKTLMKPIYAQIERPRANLGASGPPGRAD